VADPGRTWDSPLWTPCISPFRSLLHCGRRHRLLSDPSAEMCVAEGRASVRVPELPLRYFNGRFKFSEVGRSWTRSGEGKPVYSVGYKDAALGSIPIARSINRKT
jgi:hypothetical protein